MATKSKSVIHADNLLYDLDASLLRLQTPIQIKENGAGNALLAKSTPIYELIDQFNSHYSAAADSNTMNDQSITAKGASEQARPHLVPSLKHQHYLESFDENYKIMSDSAVGQSEQIRQQRFSQKSWLSNASFDEFNAKYGIPLSLQGMSPFDDLENEEYFDWESEEIEAPVLVPEKMDKEVNAKQDEKQNTHIPMDPPIPPLRKRVFRVNCETKPSTLPSGRPPKKLPPIPNT
ncbi:hypothetical protein BDR26DRAFT_938546 [Obelidium mucronatum]|nr:hypothetical protein BDR26DRAFT_938546 [Obelidium mucronatum]